MQRCSYVNEKNPLYLTYHDQEWGVALHDDQKLFELLILECFQAGLSWECVLNKREAFCEAYDGFDVATVAAYDEKKIAELLANKGIIRNKLKVRASVTNAQIFMVIQQEFGSFDSYLWSFTKGEVLFEPWQEQTSSTLSDVLSKDLKQRGMKFVGTTVVYAYLQACGVINAHGPACELFVHQ